MPPDTHKAARLKRAREERERRRRAEAELRGTTAAYQAAARPPVRVQAEHKRKKAAERELRAETKATQAAAAPTKRTPEKEHAKDAARLRQRAKQRKKIKERMQAAGIGPGRDFGERLASDLQSAAINFPSGVYHVGKAVAGDVASYATTPLHPSEKPGRRTRKVGGAIAEQYKEAYRHPIRYAQEHPGFVALDVAAALSAGAGTASRVSAAGSAARATRAAGGSRLRAAGQAVSRAPAEGGSLLGRPLPGRRTHRYEGQPIQGRYSQNALARGVQKLQDRKTGGQIGARKAARLIGEEQRLVSAAERTPALRAAALQKGLSTPEEMAVRVVAEGLPLDDVIAFSRRQAASMKGKARKRHARTAQLLEAARPYLDEVDGKPVISQSVRPELHRAYEAGRTAAQKRTKGLREAGLLAEEQERFRVSAPGRVMLGARYEPTPIGTKGPQFNLIGKRVRTRDGVRGVITEVSGSSATIRPWRKGMEPFTESLDDVFPASKTAKGRLVGGGRAVQFERPRTLPEAEARITELEGFLEPRFQRLANARQQSAEAFSAEGGPRTGQGGTSRKMGEDFRIGRGQTGHFVEDPRGVRAPLPYKSGAEQARAWIENDVYTRARKPGAPDWLKDIGDKMDELDELKAAVSQEKGGGIFEELPEGGAQLGMETETRATEAFQGGEFRVPESRLSKMPKGTPQWRGGVPRKPGTLTQPYTGAARLSGQTTREPLLAIAEDAIQAERYLAPERLRQRVLPMGRRQRPPDTKLQKWVPVRERPLKPAEAAQLRKALEDVNLDTLTPDEAARADAALSQIVESAFPERELGHVAAGTEIPGVVWVDRRLVANVSSVRQKWVGLDTLQDAVKGLILYGKPGYVAPNVLGNIGFNLFQQGPLAPANWARATRLSPEEAALIDSAMGEGFARALAAGTRSPISEGVQRAGNFWSRFVDGPFRRASFIHEARKRGFKTSAQRMDLIENPRKRAVYTEVAQRARDAIIDYERLTPFEQNVVRRILFVYPWVKGSTWYSAQFLRDHPIQAAVFARMGQEGASWAAEEIGPMPSWAKGSFPVFERNGQQFISYPGGVNPFGTAGGVVATAQGALYGDPARSERLVEMTGPVWQAAIETAAGRDLFTGQELKGGAFGTFGTQLGKGLPQYQLYRRGGLDFLPRVDAPALPEDAAYPYTPLSAWGQFVGGSATPRPANLEALNKYAREEGMETLNPMERARLRVKEDQKKILTGLRKSDPSWLTIPEDRKALELAFDRRAAVDATRARVRVAEGTGEPYARAVLVAEADLLAKWGIWPAADVREAKRIARTGSLEEVESFRKEVSEGGFGEYWELIKEARESAGVPG